MNGIRARPGSPSSVTSTTAGRPWLEVHAQGASDSAALLPFAEFGTGDYYCFDYGRQGQAGEPVVVLWSHETAQTRDVAEGFADFLRTVERPGEVH
ncbi:MAG: SMI1/KNR4 family protein [Candidatus Pseudomonas colombiensis]|nr:MAG: SMI1/KNR4 family protein [Pseudomonas sp.]